MKKLITSLFTALAFFLAVGLSSNAQTESKFQEFNSFSGINIVGPFEVSIRQGYNYSVDWTVDTALKDYVEVYSKNRILNLEYNQKGIPSSLKKVYRGKNGRVAVMKVVITLPEFSELRLSDNASVDAGTGGAVFESDNLLIDATGNSKITSLSFNADKASITVSKNANVTINLNANEIDVTSSGNGIALLQQDSDKINVNASGSSSVTAKGNTMDINLTTANSSKVAMDGTAKDIVVNAQGSSEVDALNMFVNDAELTVNSATVTVNAAENLSVDLKSGARVYFQEDPVIKLVDIQSSTLSRYTGEAPKRKGIRIF
ncbi:MAG: DUF2807 domain-containing protein [Bacteroidales bacterium]|jgi:hypothetical protein|nr:DUF2807 domain-containing protein [Bacteroidales bacterium]